MAETRVCEQCGLEFAPRREHARFCSSRCRVAWNRANAGVLAAGASALGWSVTAMSDVTGRRLARVRASDWPRALAVIGEAVWWVTLVDATLVRYHPDTYDSVLASRSPAERLSTEGILAGLRFVRNQMGVRLDPADFINPGPPGSRDAGVTACMWNPLPAPACVSLSARAQSWEMDRYRAYQARLAGHTVGETFGRAADFLVRTAVNAPAIVDPGARTAQ